MMVSARYFKQKLHIPRRLSENKKVRNFHTLHRARYKFVYMRLILAFVALHGDVASVRLPTISSQKTLRKLKPEKSLPGH